MVQYIIKSFIQPLILDNLLKTGNTDFSEQNHEIMYILEENTPVVQGWMPGQYATGGPCSHNPYILHGGGDSYEDENGSLTLNRPLVRASGL